MQVLHKTRRTLDSIKERKEEDIFSSPKKRGVGMLSLGEDGKLPKKLRKER